MVAIDQLDIVRQIDIGGQHRARGFLAQGEEHVITIVQLENNALEIQE